MIAGPVFQAGPKEEATARNQPPPRAGFDRFLKTAAVTGFTPPKTPARGPEEATARRDPGDAKMRRTYAQEKPRPGEKEPLSIEEYALGQGSATGTDTARVQNPLQPAQATQDAEAADIPSAALTVAGDPQQLGKAAQGTSQFAQIGLAAYRLSPHSNGELAKAEEAGLLPPGSATPEGMPLGGEADKLTNAALFEPGTPPEPEVGGKQAGPRTPGEILNLARQRTAEEILQTEAELEQAKADNPKAKQDAFTKTGATAPDPAQALLHQRNLGLEAQLHQQNQGHGEGGANAALQHAETAATAAPAPGHPATPAQAAAHLASATAAPDPQQMIDRIADQARWLIRNHRNEVTMRLHPRELGDLKLRVVQTGRAWQVDMTVDNHAAKRLIETNLDHLHNQLQGETGGQQQYSFNVDVRQGNDPQRFQAFGPGPRADSLLAGVDNVNDSDAVLTRQRPVWGRSGVGIYV